MNKKNKYLSISVWMAFAVILLLTTFRGVFALPAVQILGEYVVSGGLTATTSVNANLTASGTIAFPSLGSSNLCLKTDSDGKLATTTCGGSGPNFHVATSSGSVSFNLATSTDTLTLSLHQVLVDISGLATTTNNFIVGNGSTWTVKTLATTTGNLLVASSTNGWGVLAIESNGKVLTASSTAESGVSWETATAGTGTQVYNTFEFEMNPAGAATPTSTPAGSNKKIGTNWTVHTLDYATASDEVAFWSKKLPTFTAIGSCAYSYSAFTDSVTGTSTMRFTFRNVAADAVLDATTGEVAATSSIQISTAADVFTGSLTLATSTIASGEVLLAELSRDTADSSDTMAADLRVMSGTLLCTYR